MKRDWPKWLYRLDDAGGIEPRLFHDQSEVDGEGWAESPADLEDDPTAEAPKRKRGRPPKTKEPGAEVTDDGDNGA